MEPYSHRPVKFPTSTASIKQGMRTDICCLSSSVHMQVVNKRLSLFLSTSLTLVVKSLLPPAFGIARRRLQDESASRADPMENLCLGWLAFRRLGPWSLGKEKEQDDPLLAACSFTGLSIAWNYSPQQTPSSPQLPKPAVLPLFIPLGH